MTGLTHLSATTREEEHGLALAQQLVGRHRRRLHSAKPVKQLPLRSLPMLWVGQASHLHRGDPHVYAREEITNQYNASCTQLPWSFFKIAILSRPKKCAYSWGLRGQL